MLDVAPPLAHRPRSVVNAARSMIALAAASAVTLAVLLVRMDAVRAKLRDATPRPSDGAVSVSMTVTIIGYLAPLVLLPLLTRHVTQGRNWARLATWAVAGIGVVAAVVFLGRPQLGALRVLEIVRLVLDVAVVALLVVPPSSRWFRSR
jgi:hypothetical protein